jgi:transglutaminase-like putative cysteine protease
VKAIALFAAALVTVWRLSNHYGESFNPVAFFVDACAHASLIFGLMFHVRRPMFGHPAMLGLGLLVVMLSMASGASSQSIAAQVTVSLVACIAFLFASRFILHAWYIDQRAKRGQTVLANRSRQEGRSFTGSTVDGSSNRFLGLDQRFGVDRQRIGWLFTVVTLSVLLMTTSGLASLTSTVLPEVQRFVQDRLKSSLEAVNVAESIGSSHYVRGARLGSLRRVMMVNPGEIALRAHSDYRPGYLRGSVFDYYSQGRWEEFDNSQVRSSQAIRSYERRTVRSSGAGTVALRGRSYVKLRRFEVGEPGNQTFSTVQIENDPSKGYVFFSPLGTQWIEARASRVSVNSHGVIESGINTQYPYIAGVSSRPAVDPMDPRRREVLTYLDNPTRAFVSKLASDVCDDQLTSINKAAAIANHFQENYEYSLQGAPVPGRGDPLFHFLKTKHPAHCELFASATVLMLRSVGVPARYVTGYISDEFSDEEESWVARNKDAHAWAEAYDDVRQVWFPVESTPGRSYMTLSLEGENRNSLADTLIRLEEDSSDSVSVVSRITGWLLSSRATDPLSILIRFAQVPLFLLGVILLWRRLRRGQSTGLSDDDIKSRKMLALVDRKLARLSFHRAVGETLHQFAGRIENAESLPQPGRSESSSVNDFRAVRGYANWYREFAEARYQGRLPEPYVER